MKGSLTLRFRTAVILAALTPLVVSTGQALSTDKTLAADSPYPTLVQNDPDSGGLILRQANSRPQTEVTVESGQPAIAAAPPLERPAPAPPPARSEPPLEATQQVIPSQAALQVAQDNRQLDNRMAAIERLLEQSRQQDRSMLMMMITITLIVSGVTGLTGIGAVIAVVILQARWINRVSENALAQTAPSAPPTLGWGAQGLPEPARANPGLQASRQQFSEAVQNLRAQISAMENGSAFEPGQTGPGAPVVTADAGDGDEYEVTKLAEKGSQLLDIGRADRALVCFDQATVLAPGNPDIHLKRARALEQLKRENEALEAYDQVLAIDSSLVAANLGKAGILNRLERYNEALECYEKALGHASAPRRPVV